jgi:hypothetical protein
MEAAMIDPNSIKSTSLCPINEINLLVGCPVSHNDGQSWPLKTIAPALMLLAIMAFSISPCLAEESGWSPGLFQNQGIEQSGIHVSLYDLEPTPVNDLNMTGFETQTNNNPVPGLSIFDYSFDQQSENLDADYKPEPFTSEQWYFDLSGGRINGDGEVPEDEIAQNNQDAAEVSLPIVGYQSKFFAVEFSEQGLAAAMITAGFTF